MEPSRVLNRLESMRRTIRRRLVGYGCCAVMAGGLAALFTVVLLDWLMWLPAGLRLLGAVLFVGGFVGASYYWIVKPAAARISTAEIAARLERHFQHLDDRLSSTVSFLCSNESTSPSMVRQVIANTDAVVGKLPMESVLTLRPLLVAAACLVIQIAVFTLLLVHVPSWMETGVYRYVYPFGSIEWPRDVAIRPQTGDEKVALGESLLVSMQVDRGLTDALRGVVHLRDGQGRTVSLALQREGHEFYTTIDAVTEDLHYWFEAGDDDTKRHPFEIEVIRRPVVVEALATVDPPPYAGRRPARTQSLADGPVHAPLGGFVTVDVTASKPIPATPDKPTGLRLDEGGMIPMRPDPDDDTHLSARFEVNSDVHFRIELVDADGFENHGASQHVIRAVPDVPPTVTILEPRAVTELTPQGSVRLLIRIEDDFGVTHAQLDARRQSDDSVIATPLTDRLAVRHLDNGVEAMAEYVWQVESLDLVPGDVVVYTVAASDNRRLPGLDEQEGRSAPMRIKIISDVEFDTRLRDELALLETRIRQVTLDETTLLDTIVTLQQGDASPQPLTDIQREETMAASGRQARLIRRLHELAQRFADLHNRMERNHAGDEHARRKVVSVGNALEEIAAGPMTAASGALSTTADHREAAEQQSSLAVAAAQADMAIERLKGLIKNMSQWGDFQGLVTRTRDLLDRQTTVRSDTARLGKSMLGKPVESLSEEETAALKRLERQQRQLETDVEQLLARMKKLHAAAKEKDTTSAESIEAAMRAARAHSLPKRLEAAAEALEGNRTAAATIEQKAAEEAIRKMVAGLRDRERRELARLRKQLFGAEEQVAQLVAMQQDLRDATGEAGMIGADASAYDSLEAKQHALARNARQISEDLADVQQAGGAARQVRMAAGAMERAQAALKDRASEPATAAQDQALELLRDAQARLEELANQTDQQLLLRTLAQVREKLESLVQAQRGVNDGIESLVEVIDRRKRESGVTPRHGRVTRSEARAASRLARDQADVRVQLNEVLPELDKVAVYAWALGRVDQWMGSCGDALNRRKIDGELVSTADRIVRELERLIQAIIDTAKMPLDTEFAEAEMEGGGKGGGAQAKKPVPTVAELLVLRAMQRDIQERTLELDESLNLEDATEAELRELKALGEDQLEVRRLTEKLTEKARHP